MVEMGLRPYRELIPMRKGQVDLENGIVHLPDSKTVNGIADMPMTEQSPSSVRLTDEAERRFQLLVPEPADGVAASRTLRDGAKAVEPDAAGAPGCRIFRYTSCATRSRRGSAPGAWRIIS